MRYVKARRSHEEAELEFRIYVTDALLGLGGFQGVPRYYDLITGNWTPPEQETRTPEAIKDGIKDRLRRIREE